MEHAAICHPRRRRLELLTLHKNLLLLLMLMVMVAGLGYFPPHITPAGTTILIKRDKLTNRIAISYHKLK